MNKKSFLLFHHLKFISIFVLVFLLNNTSIIAQTQKVNDWETELVKAKGQDRVDLIVELTYDLIKENISLADSLAKEGITLAKQLGDSLGMYRIETHLGRIYGLRGQFNEGIEIIEKSVAHFDKKKSLAFDKAKAQLMLAPIYVAKSNFNRADSLIYASESYFSTTDHLFWKYKILQVRGHLHLDKDEDEQSLNYFSKALDISRQLNDVEYTAIAMGNMALTKAMQGHYAESLEWEFQIISTECNFLTKAKSYARMGQTYSILKDFKPAVKYLKLSIELYNKVGFECEASRCIYALGVVQRKQLNYGEALKYYKEALNLQEKCKFYTGGTLGAIGNIYSNLGQPNKANKYYDEQLELATAKNIWGGIYYANYNRGYYAYKDNRYDEALKYALESYQMAVKKGRLLYLVESNELLFEIYDSLRNDNKAKFHWEQFSFYKDSISNYKKIKKIGALEQIHLTKTLIDSLDLANQNDNAINQHKGLSNTLKIAIGLSLLVLSIYLFFLSSKKRQKNEVLSTENKPLDKEKLDQYFETMFARLDQNKVIIKSDKNQPSNPSTTPIHDMAEFLKTNLSTPNDWVPFEHYFTKVHKDFFKDLKSTYPNISINELNMCALIKLNLRSKDIAQIMGISPDSVRKAQNRLSKRLGLSSNENLRDFVLKL